MPQKGQKTITLSENKTMDRIKMIAKKENRSVSEIFRLLAEESFGQDKETVKIANDVLTSLRSRYQ